MKRNDRVIADFLNGKSSKNAHLYSDGERLINYSTCIAQWVGWQLILNRTRYSRTTSKIQSELLSQSNTLQPVYANDIPMGTGWLAARSTYRYDRERVLDLANYVYSPKLRDYIKRLSEQMTEQTAKSIRSKVEYLACIESSKRSERLHEKTLQKFYIA